MSRFSAIGFWVNKATGVVYEPDFQAYLDALVTPLSAGQRTLINNFYVSVKTVFNINLLSDAFDFLQYWGNETAESGLKNLVKRTNTHDGQAVNSPAFTALEGFTGDALSAYVNTNYNPATQRVNYSLLSACLISYSRTNNTTAASDLGARTGTNDYTAVYTYLTGNYACRVHQGIGGGNINNANTIGTHGMMILQRTGNTSLEFYHNKTKFTQASAAAATNIPNCNLFGLARNFAGTAEQFSNRQLSLVGACRKMTQSEAEGFTDAFETLMDSNEKGVI